MKKILTLLPLVVIILLAGSCKKDAGSTTINDPSTTSNSNGNGGSGTTTGPDVYVAGYEYPNFNAKYWKNGVPTILGSGLASCIYILGSDVYVGGMMEVHWERGELCIGKMVSRPL